MSVVNATPAAKRVNVAVTGLIVCSAGIAVAAAGASGGVVAACVAPILGLVAIRARLQPVLQSPVWVVTIVVLGIGLLGYGCNGALMDAKGASISGELPPGVAQRGVLLFGASIGFLVVGAAFVALLRAPMARTQLKRMEVPERVRRWLLPISIIPLLMTIHGGQILNRPEHLRNISGTSVSGLGNQLSIGAVAVLGYLMATERGVRRALVAIMGVLYLALYFALSSRRISVVPLVFALGVHVAVLSKRSKMGIALAAVVAAYLLPLPLFMRGQASQGLIPYCHYLPGYLTGANVSWTDTLNNVLVAFPISCLTAFATNHIPVGHLLVELNPLPGRMTSWYTFNHTMGLNGATPYAGVGEIGNVGWYAVAIIWVSIGIVLVLLDGQVNRFMRSGNQLAGVAVTGLCAMFGVLIVQYPTRNSVRELYYALAIVALVRGGGIMVRRQRA